MKTTYSDEMLKEINDKVNLVDYVSQSIELRKKGKDFWGHCPLHIDNTPSFSVSEDENAYYCFSCGRGGGIISFLKNYEGLTFDEAVEKAAKLADLDLSKMCRSKTIAFLEKILAIATKKKQPFEHRILGEDVLDKYQREPVPEWLEEGITQETMDEFDIRVDTWGNRIVYPVYDIDGNLINIKGRTRYANFKELKLPKYINYFEVGVMDYFQGLERTLPYVKEKNEIIIFESIKSVMKAYDWGYKNCVSAEKHTLTDEQISLLIKLHVDVVFAFDSDVDYRSPDIKASIDKLKRITNVFVIRDKEKLLGGVEAKNSPADCGREIWEKLYAAKKKML